MCCVRRVNSLAHSEPNLAPFVISKKRTRQIVPQHSQVTGEAYPMISCPCLSTKLTSCTIRIFMSTSLPELKTGVKDFLNLFYKPCGTNELPSPLATGLGWLGASFAPSSARLEPYRSDFCPAPCETALPLRLIALAAAYPRRYPSALWSPREPRTIAAAFLKRPFM